MAEESATRKLIQEMFEASGRTLSDEDLDIVSKLHDSYAGQRSRLTPAARPETEPMIIPAFDRAAAKGGDR